jgi:signal transduction histidine kinase/ligand-binding sensor domain-containing protein
MGTAQRLSDPNPLAYLPYGGGDCLPYGGHEATGESLRNDRSRAHDSSTVLPPCGRVFRLHWLAILLASSAVLWGADDRDPAWFVRVWKTSEGLAGDYVAGVIQTDDGFLWILAGGQLEQFDGVKLKRFTLEAVGGGSEHRIREFVRTRDGGMAFALFDGSLVRVNRNGQQTVATLPQSRVEFLFEEPGGFLVVFRDATVYRIRDGRSTQLTEEDGLPAGAHCRFTTDRNGQVWFTKGENVGIQRGDKFETLYQLAGAPHVAAAHDGGVWIGTGNRLLRVEAGGALREVAVLSLKDISVRPNVLLEDRRGAVWFGTYDRGLFRFDGTRFESVPVSHREVISLTEDNEGSLWVGTSGGGLDQVQPRGITIEGGESGLPYEAVLGLAEDTHGTLWGFTQAGFLVMRQNGTWQPYDKIKTAGRVNALAAGPDGALWIGTRNDVLHCWRDGRLTTWSEGIAGSSERRIVATQGGDVWIASSHPGVIQRLRQGRLERFELPKPADMIRSMVEDHVGNIWVAANGHRLTRITPDGHVIDESAAIAAVDRPIRVLLPSPDGTLWIAYDQGGIGRLQNGVFNQVTTKAGLLDDNIEVLLSDGRGWLWLASHEAIFKVSEREIAALVEGHIRRVQPVRYGQDQGVRPTFGESIGALCRRDGRLWIPMATALAIIDPSQQRAPAEPPPTWVTEVKVDERTIAAHRSVMPLGSVAPVEGTELRLAPDHRRLDIDFTALSYRTPSNVLFQYRLEDFDDHWIEAGVRRSASYSRLVTGHYRFRVRACNSDGVWNNVGTSLALAVDPFFWDTWWFRGSAIALFTIVVFAVTRYVSHRRLRQQLRAAEQEAAVERERARIARDIHDDLGSRLTKIVLLSGLVTREHDAPEKATEHVQEITDTARQLLKSLDETVWAINPRNDTLPHLVSYIGQYAVQFLRTAEIACHLELPDDPAEIPVSAEVRHQLFLAVKEALTNVVRHARASKVILRVVITSDGFELSIADDGQGCTGDSDDPGADGLRNMQQRMGHLGGQVRFESKPTAGTRVTFVLPLSTVTH